MSTQLFIVSIYSRLHLVNVLSAFLSDLSETFHRFQRRSSKNLRSFSHSVALAQHKYTHCRYLTNTFAITTRRYKQQKQHPQELPKSPIPPPSVEEYVPTPTLTSDYTLRSTIILPHDHQDEIREERVHLSQVFQTLDYFFPFEWWYKWNVFLYIFLYIISYLC